MKRGTVVSIVLSIVSLGLATSGCGQSQPKISAASASFHIPTEFWHKLDRPIRLTTFPRTPGETHCEIPEGGAHLSGTALIAGSCTTRIQHLSPADLPHVPASLRSQATAKVVLSQRWGVDQSATFTFIINRTGTVLIEDVTGQPPQFEK